MKVTRSIVLPLGAIFVGLVAIGAMLSSWPRPSAPLPIVSVLLLWQTGLPVASILYGPVLFLLWCWPLASGPPNIPKRSVWLFAILVVLSALAYGYGWDYAMEWQGSTYTWSVTTINVLIVALLSSFLIMNRRSPRHWTNYGFHILLFSWLVSYWVPYMGEMP